MFPYLVTTPSWFRLLFPGKLVWEMPVKSLPTVYITFDDGPHPTATPFVLKQLEKYNATATFFCVGHNVTKYPEVYRQVMDKGHATANHTFNHLNGWKNDDKTYLANIEKADTFIKGNLFRPPYGQIKRSQASQLYSLHPDWKIIMWSILSGDFDQKLTPEKCLNNVLRNIKPGSIVLFHDSEKAWDRMSYALPRVLEYCTAHNWIVRALPHDF